MTAPRAFQLIGILLLLWNLMGIGAFIMQYSADLNQLAKTDPYAAKIFAAMPAWAWVAYAVAVGAGRLGAILLLLLDVRQAYPTRPILYASPIQ